MPDPAVKHDCPRNGNFLFAPSDCSACDEIDRLRAENAALRVAGSDLRLRCFAKPGAPGWITAVQNWDALAGSTEEEESNA